MEDLGPMAVHCLSTPQHGSLNSDLLSGFSNMCLVRAVRRYEARYSSVGNVLVPQRPRPAVAYRQTFTARPWFHGEMFKYRMRPFLIPSHREMLE